MAKAKPIEQPKMVRVIYPHKEDGWFTFAEYEIPLEILEQNKRVSKSNPDIFPIFKDQVILTIRGIFGI